MLLVEYLSLPLHVYAAATSNIVTQNLKAWWSKLYLQVAPTRVRATLLLLCVQSLDASGAVSEFTSTSICAHFAEKPI